jgi:predicted amidohydrolase
MDCTVRLSQLNPTLGDLKHNLELHLREVDAARRQGIDLLVFPELSLTGYFLKDQVNDLAIRLEDPLLARLLAMSNELSIVVGFVEHGPGDQLYNAMAFLEGGRVLHVHRKVHLVSYGMFDEARDFAPGADFRPIESRLGRLGLSICEDFWHVGGGYTYFLERCDALIVPSASPARGISAGDEGLRSVAVWDTLLSAQALLFQCWILYCNRVGWEDGIGFAGHSAIFGPEGRRRAQLEGLSPGRLDQRLNSATLERTRVRTPLRRDERPQVLLDALERALHPPLPAPAASPSRSESEPDDRGRNPRPRRP